jgi:OFA family oxalate/formate antiporter-like MFS transporter
MTETRVAEFRRGWKILLTTCLGLGFGLSGVPFYAFSFFPPSLRQEFPDWTIGQMGLAISTVTFMQFATGAFAGHFCDRHGVRRLLIPSTVLFALATAAMTLVRGPVYMLWIGYVVMALAGMFTTSVAYSRVVVTWFDRGRGLALGITMAGSAIVAMILPRLLERVMADYGGWRAGYLACAALALLPLPLLLMYLRERELPGSEHTRASYGMTVREAVRTRPFIVMVLSAALYSPGIQSIVTHLKTLVGDMGVPPAEIGNTLSWLGLGILLGRLTAGTLLDAFRTRPAIAVLLFLVPAISFFIFESQIGGYAWVAVLLLGMSVGIEGDVFAYMTSRFFGVRSYAELFGWIFGVMCVAGAVGPLFVLWLEGLLGETAKALHTATLIYMFMFIGSAFLLAFVGKYPEWKAIDRE